MSGENQLRILIELSSSDPRVGAVNDALDLAHFAGTSDVRFFVCGPINAELAELATREGMTVIGACSRMISRHGALPYLGSVLAWIGRLCRIRPHVVHLNYAGWGPSLACAAWILRIPIVARAAPEYRSGQPPERVGCRVRRERPGARALPPGIALGRPGAGNR